jgi:phospholysine phosphohistidine inorganic pyrophosphate phosphatase
MPHAKNDAPLELLADGSSVDAVVTPWERDGLKTALVRTGKFRPDDVERGTVRPDVILSSSADFPDWLETA